MTPEFIYIAIENIELIKDSPTESLHRSAFKHSGEKGLSLDEIISFLIANDFIEIEVKDDIYFLTPETYKLIEDDTLEWHVQARSGYLQDYEDEEAELSEEEAELWVEYSNKQRQFKKISRYASVLLFLLLGFLLVVKLTSSPAELTELPEIEISDELQEKLQHVTDSINKSNNLQILDSLHYPH